ncbi:MAG: hypothetical protein PHW25_18910 [Zoogloea sp.]|uniref:hypothetical protein n=1 Tax=Zoogloea sp. TaxID=49181 RepID=UPI00261F1FC7|nr:hypothetical protein [Zoogloea sp.]MDD3329156.1 hypothetical protein [Zoogloea sp.]
MGTAVRWQQRFDNFGRALHPLTLGVELAATRLDESPIPYIVVLSLFTQIDNPQLVEHIQRA